MWTKGVEMSPPSTVHSPLHFVHGEAELAASAGIAEKKFRAERVRYLRQGEHWDIRGQRVAYTPAGLQLVLESLLGRECLAAELAAALNGSRLVEPEKKAPPLVAKVVKTWPNPWLLTVQLPEGRAVNLRVKSSKNFRRGMECPVRVNEQGQYELARRLPRFPGKW